MTATMKPTLIHLPAEMLEWLKSQPEGMAATIRQLVATEMERQNKINQLPTAA